MHTKLSAQFLNTAEGQVASEVISRCVHCGYCNATCPTYQLLGDELDGPRGRIYQLKQVFEGAQPSQQLALHLDRCLTCRNCETTCPSGVEYHRLLDVGRNIVEPYANRSKLEKLIRWGLKRFLTRRHWVSLLMSLVQPVRAFLPKAIKKSIPAKQKIGDWPDSSHSRKMLLLAGCVQPAMKPLTNAATARVLDKLGITVQMTTKDGCCGALDYHLNDHQQAKVQLKRNIDAWWPSVEQGVEAIISTASGCGVMIKDYANVLAQDLVYLEKARKIAALTKDISEVLAGEDLTVLQTTSNLKVAFHPPCTLQHGQKLTGVVESILKRCGYQLTAIRDSNLCCGSAGTYSIFQKPLANELLVNKLNAINQGKPELIATANIGCQLHLESAADVPVIHWIELLDRDLSAV